MIRRHGRLRRRLSPALARRSARRARARVERGWGQLRRAWYAAVRSVRDAATRAREAVFSALGAVRRMSRLLLVRARRPVLVTAGLALLSITIGAGAFAATTLFTDYGAPRTPVNVVTWAQRSPLYLAGDCTSCHSSVEAIARVSGHRRLLCESCHDPQTAHPGPDPAVLVRQPSSGDESCVACHALTEARPAGFSQVDLDGHYSGAACLRCHQPHDSVAVTPREVTHPLARLPECTVCHAPDGLKRYPSSHRAEPDDSCLACHRIGAGGDE